MECLVVIIRESIRKCAECWESMIKFAETCAESWESVLKVDKEWDIVPNAEKVC